METAGVLDAFGNRFAAPRPFAGSASAPSAIHRAASSPSTFDQDFATLAQPPGTTAGHALGLAGNARTLPLGIGALGAFSSPLILNDRAFSPFSSSSSSPGSAGAAASGAANANANGLSSLWAAPAPEAPSPSRVAMMHAHAHAQNHGHRHGQTPPPDARFGGSNGNGMANGGGFGYAGMRDNELLMASLSLNPAAGGGGPMPSPSHAMMAHRNFAGNASNSMPPPGFAPRAVTPSYANGGLSKHFDDWTRAPPVPVIKTTSSPIPYYHQRDGPNSDSAALWAARAGSGGHREAQSIATRVAASALPMLENDHDPLMADAQQPLAAQAPPAPKEPANDPVAQALAQGRKLSGRWCDYKNNACPDGADCEYAHTSEEAYCAFCCQSGHCKDDHSECLVCNSHEHRRHECDKKKLWTDGKAHPCPQKQNCTAPVKNGKSTCKYAHSFAEALCVMCFGRGHTMAICASLRCEHCKEKGHHHSNYLVCPLHPDYNKARKLNGNAPPPQIKGVRFGGQHYDEHAGYDIFDERLSPAYLGELKKQFMKEQKKSELLARKSEFNQQMIMNMRANSGLNHGAPMYNMMDRRISPSAHAHGHGPANFGMGGPPFRRMDFKEEKEREALENGADFTSMQPMEGVGGLPGDGEAGMDGSRSNDGDTLVSPEGFTLCGKWCIDTNKCKKRACRHAHVPAEAYCGACGRIGHCKTDHEECLMCGSMEHKETDCQVKRNAKTTMCILGAKCPFYLDGNTCYHIHSWKEARCVKCYAVGHGMFLCRDLTCRRCGIAGHHEVNYRVCTMHPNFDPSRAKPAKLGCYKADMHWDPSEYDVYDPIFRAVEQKFHKDNKKKNRTG